MPSDKNDLVLADVVQQFIPRWWPFNVYFSLYVHAVLTLEQSTSGGLQCCWQTCMSSMLRSTGAFPIWVLVSTLHHQPFSKSQCCQAAPAVKHHAEQRPFGSLQVTWPCVPPQPLDLC